MKEPTLVKENARLELLRHLADWREHVAPMMAKVSPQINWFGPQPLGAGFIRADEMCGPSAPEGSRLFENHWEDIVLAAEESAKIGHVELYRPNGELPFMLRQAEFWMVRITEAGYEWIKTHDVLGEVRQECPEARAGEG